MQLACWRCVKSFSKRYKSISTLILAMVISYTLIACSDISSISFSSSVKGKVVSIENTEAVTPFPVFTAYPSYEYFEKEVDRSKDCIPQAPVKTADLNYQISELVYVDEPVSTVVITPDGKFVLYRRYGDKAIYIYDIANQTRYDKIIPKPHEQFPSHMETELDVYYTHDSKQFLWRVWGSGDKIEYTDDDHLTFIYAYNLEDKTVTRTKFEMTKKSFVSEGFQILRILSDYEFLYVDSKCRKKVNDLSQCSFGIISPEGRRPIKVKYTPNAKEITSTNIEMARTLGAREINGKFLILESYQSITADGVKCESGVDGLNSGCSRSFCFGEFIKQSETIQFKCDKEFSTRTGVRTASSISKKLYVSSQTYINSPIVAWMGTSDNFFEKGLCGFKDEGQWLRIATAENIIFLYNRQFIIGYDLSLDKVVSIIKFKDMQIFDFQASQTGNVIAWADQRRDLGLYVVKLEGK